MASTRESSPALSESGSAPASPLTPNSKIKALLAGLDSESDDDDASGSVKKDLANVLRKLTPSKVATIVEGGIPLDKDATPSRSTESSSEDEEIVRPKGRMAARMLAEGNGSEEDAAVDARERVRRMLAARSKSGTPEIDDDGDDESDVAAVPRKRKIQRGRRATPQSSPAKGSASPGLFVSPEKRGSASPAHNASDSDDDLPTNPMKDARFMALVAKKREERQARDAEAAKEKAKKAAESKRYTEMMQEDEISDEDGNRRLTQQTRPSRKASKRALEDINRESQRLSRNQQLTHQAVTKKKITKQSLFAKFNFRTDSADVARPTSSSSGAPHSDVEMKDTPPTSPASHHGEEKETTPAVETGINNDDELPTLEEVLASSSPPRIDKGKGKAVEEEEPIVENAVEEVKLSRKPNFKQRPIKIHPPTPSKRTAISLMDDSDSDLEVVVAKTPKIKLQQKLEAMFNNVPANQSRESQSLHTLRMLAHLGSPGKQNTGRNKKPSMTTSELTMSLQQRARQQALREREERLQALRDRGIVIQTAEEREKEMVDVDDILAAARREQDEIAVREKAAAKKERKDNGEVDPLGDNSSDDEDWEESKAVADEELSLSGSDEEENESGEEDEADEEDVDAEDKEAAQTSNPLFDNEASEDEDEEEDANEVVSEDADVMDIDEDETEALPVHRRVRKSNVISDDEDEDQSAEENVTPVLDQAKSPMPPMTQSPMAPNSVLRSATKTFIPGLTVNGVAGLGLTQIFAGTMDESQIGTYEASQDDARPASPQQAVSQKSMSFLKRFAAPELPPFIPTMSEDTQDVSGDSPSQATHIPESQPTQEVSQGVDLHFSQSQIRDFETQDYSASQFPDLTQDMGFAEYTPIKGRYAAPPSTIDTVVLEPTTFPESIQESPIAKKKSKLRRRAPIVAEFSDEEDIGESAGIENDFELTADAFNVMKKAAKKKAVVDDFNKKESKAKEMVHDQAEESEDEYAGLGGASDDESGGEEDAFVKEMIDDEAGKNVDESKLAAFYA